jgi:hypothetical protein
MRGYKPLADRSAGSDAAQSNGRLARVNRSIAEIERDGRPLGIKQNLLAALRKERDALEAALAKPLDTALKKPRQGANEKPAGFVGKSMS